MLHRRKGIQRWYSKPGRHANGHRDRGNIKNPAYWTSAEESRRQTLGCVSSEPLPVTVRSFDEVGSFLEQSGP
jgi:hypothetical protein